MSIKIRRMEQWKIVISVVRFMALITLVGCAPLVAADAQQLIADLKKEGLTFESGKPGLGSNSALFSPHLYPLSFMLYERRGDDGKLTDSLLLYVSQEITQSDQSKDALQNYVDDPHGLGGLDLAGPVRYYQCNRVIAVYQGMWETGIDPAIDAGLAEKCGAAFARYPAD